MPLLKFNLSSCYYNGTAAKRLVSFASLPTTVERTSFISPSLFFLLKRRLKRFLNKQAANAGINAPARALPTPIPAALIAVTWPTGTDSEDETGHLEAVGDVEGVAMVGTDATVATVGYIPVIGSMGSVAIAGVEAVEGTFGSDSIG